MDPIPGIHNHSPSGNLEPEGSKTASKGAQTASFDAQTAENDAQTAENDAQTAENDAQTAENDAQTAENDAQTAEKDAQTAEKDAQTAEKNAEAEAKKNDWLSLLDGLEKAAYYYDEYVRRAMDAASNLLNITRAYANANAPPHFHAKFKGPRSGPVEDAEAACAAAIGAWNNYVDYCTLRNMAIDDCWPNIPLKQIDDDAGNVDFYEQRVLYYLCEAIKQARKAVTDAVAATAARDVAFKCVGYAAAAGAAATAAAAAANNAVDAADAANSIAMLVIDVHAINPANAAARDAVASGLAATESDADIYAAGFTAAGAVDKGYAKLTDATNAAKKAAENAALANAAAVASASHLATATAGAVAAGVADTTGAEC
jgi:hypothetical protein